MKKNMKQIWIGFEVVVLLTLLCCMPLAADAARSERKPPAVDAEQYADFMENMALGVEDLAEGAEIQREFFDRITPPGVDLLQPMFPPVVPFEDFAYTDAFLEGILGIDRNSVTIYPISLLLDPETRKTLVYNIEGKLIATSPNLWGPRMDWGDSLHSRVTMLVDLLPSEDVEQYLYTEARIFQTLMAIVRKPKSGGGMSQKSMGCASNEFGIVAIQKLTNGAMRITVSEGTNEINITEMFAYTVEHTNTVTNGIVIWHLASPGYDGVDEPWVCRATNLVFTNGVTTWDDESISTNARQRMYAVAERGDSDSDELTDGSEFFVYLTNPDDADTDGDGMDDGWEVENNLDPLEDDAAGNEDGDGLSNHQEFLFETDPQEADTDQDGLGDGEEVAAGLDPLFNPLLHRQTEWSFSYDVHNRLTAVTSTAAGVSMAYDDAANLTTISCTEGE